MARAADVMDASGLVVWLGDAAGGDLRPVIAHGYSNQVLARMPAVPRSANNAAAAAYRAGQLQIVLARPGSASGAIAAPLLSSAGCIGTLSAEIRDGGEASDSVQALAAIFAAQLAGVLATTPRPPSSGLSRQPLEQFSLRSVRAFRRTTHPVRLKPDTRTYAYGTRSND